MGLKAIRVHSKKQKNEVSGFNVVTMGHPQGPVATLYLRVIHPFVLCSEALAVPSGRETKVAAQCGPVLRSLRLSWGRVGFESGEGSRLGLAMP